MSQRRAVAGATAASYHRARRKDKEHILSQFVELTKYSRQYTARLLRQHGKKVRLRQTTIVGDVRKKEKRTPRRIYNDEVLEALKRIWMIMDCICGKRLVEIPSREDEPPFFTLTTSIRGNSRQIGELLTLIVTPEPHRWTRTSGERAF